jgi:hypothetical protein
VRHNEADLEAMLDGAFDILAMERHAKMEEGDSIYVVARKKRTGVEQLMGSE